MNSLHSSHSYDCCQPVVKDTAAASFTFMLVDRHDDKFEEAWRKHVETLSPESSLEHIDIMIACEPDHEHYFVVGFNESNDLVTVAYLGVQRVDIALGWRLRVLALGGSLTSDSIWVDRSLVSYKEVIGQLVVFAKQHIRPALIVLKPFDSQRDIALLKCHEGELGFINICGPTQAEVELRGITSYEQFLATLTKKKRYYLRKIDKDAAAAGLEVELTTNFADMGPAIYPLYLNVAERAQEVRDLETLPLRYFEGVAQLTAMNAQLVLMRARGRLIGFMLLLEKNSILCCGACGMDHSVAKTYNVWYVLMLQAIKYGIRSGKNKVILGTTNYSMKRKFEAVRHDLWISIRFGSRLLTILLGPLIRAWLHWKIFVGNETEGDIAEA